MPRCDIGASGITETAQRKEAGIEFSVATYRNKLVALVHGVIESNGRWAFFKPLHPSVWLAVLGTIFAVPFVVFLCEYVLSRRCGLATLGTLCSPLHMEGWRSRVSAAAEHVALHGLCSMRA